VGVGTPDINIVVKLQKLGFFHAERSIVEIGAQQMSGSMFANVDWIADCAEAFGVEKRDFKGPSGGQIVHGEVVAQDSEAPSARDLWQWLGFKYASIDVDGSPGAIPLDLNFAET